ncbi:MAG: MBL fold metallo-hydrolase [Methanobacterium sp.]
MKVTALIEDLDGADLGLRGEKGLSIHISDDDETILFDTGVTGKFVSNAQKLGIDLEDVSATAISHGHFDHCGGLRSFFGVNDESPVYIQNKADEEHYFKGFLFIKRNIGMEKDIFFEYNNRIKFINEFREILDDVFLLNDIKSKYPTPAGNKYNYMKKGNELIHDNFDHEQMMVIKDNKELVIFTGCSHHGVLNMVDAAVHQFPDTPIKALFGGFHFIGLPFFNHMAETEFNIKFTGLKLLDYPIEKVYTGHCTGRKAYPILKKVMGDKVEYFKTGDSVEL